MKVRSTPQCGLQGSNLSVTQPDPKQYNTRRYNDSGGLHESESMSMLNSARQRLHPPVLLSHGAAVLALPPVFDGLGKPRRLLARVRVCEEAAPGNHASEAQFAADNTSGKS